MRRIVHILLASISLTTLFIISAQPVWAAPLAHEAPPGSEWVMADWMFLAFMVFAGTAFVAFLLALKAGLLSNLEDAKYYILEIEEQENFNTPDWARDGGDS